jgi:hypothetical protein
MNREEWTKHKEEVNELRKNRKHKIYFNGTRYEKTKPISFGANEEKRKKKEARENIKTYEREQMKAAKQQGKL